MKLASHIDYEAGAASLQMGARTISHLAWKLMETTLAEEDSEPDGWKHRERILGDIGEIVESWIGELSEKKAEQRDKERGIR